MAYISREAHQLRESLIKALNDLGLGGSIRFTLKGSIAWDLPPINFGYGIISNMVVYFPYMHWEEINIRQLGREGTRLHPHIHGESGYMCIDRPTMKEAIISLNKMEYSKCLMQLFSIVSSINTADVYNTAVGLFSCSTPGCKEYGIGNFESLSYVDHTAINGTTAKIVQRNKVFSCGRHTEMCPSCFVIYTKDSFTKIKRPGFMNLQNVCLDCASSICKKCGNRRGRNDMEDGVCRDCVINENAMEADRKRRRQQLISYHQEMIGTVIALDYGPPPEEATEVNENQAQQVPFDFEAPPFISADTSFTGGISTIETRSTEAF